MSKRTIEEMIERINDEIEPIEWVLSHELYAQDVLESMKYGLETWKATRGLIVRVREWQKICRNYTAQGYREMSGEGFEEAADMMREIRDYGKEVNHENI